MEIVKVIQKIQIQSAYKNFVEKFRVELLTTFPGKIHSLYMCGSMPKGTAVPFKSDADFTIVCENPEDIDYAKVKDLKDQALVEFPFVTKIDTIVCSIEEVLAMPHEWGFWIKIICVCVYGKDLGEDVPPIHITPQFVLDLNNDTEETVKRVRGALIDASNEPMRTRYTKGYSKRLIRALYSLVLEDTGVWQDELLDMKKAIISYSGINGDLVEYLYASYLDTNVEVNEFLGVADQVYAYIESSLKKLADSTS